MKKAAVLIAMIVMADNIAIAESEKYIDYSKSVKASEVAKYFFGPVKSSRIKRPNLNVGRIGISAKTKLNCGRLDAVASVDAELSNLEHQLKEMAGQITRMYSSPSALAMALICYYKPQVCAYIRHGSLIFNEQLALQYDACEALDKFIDDQADKGMKKLQAENVQKCISDNSHGGSITTAMIRNCQKRDGRMRNLLKPFKTAYASGKQKVLKSIVSVVDGDGEYLTLVKLLGEVEVHENGHWVKLFPKDMTSPDDVAENYIAAGEEQACDLSKLAAIIDGSDPVPPDPFAKEIRMVIKEKVPKEAVRDLKSIPANDQKSACTAIAEGVAQIAVKRANAKNKAIMAAALSNDALPDDLRAFYRERSHLTFSAIQAKIDAEEIIPLGEVLTGLRDLALQFRTKNRESASGVSAGKILNESSGAVDGCEDELSCE